MNAGVEKSARGGSPTDLSVPNAHSFGRQSEALTPCSVYYALISRDVKPILDRTHGAVPLEPIRTGGIFMGSGDLGAIAGLGGSSNFAVFTGDCTLESSSISRAGR